MRIHREARVPYAAARMYALVDDVAAYPKFLPWCPRAEVLAAAEREKTARLTLARGGLRTSFTTRNALEPGRRIDMHLQDGPFRHLHGVWTFADVPHGCRVALDMESHRLSKVPHRLSKMQPNATLSSTMGNTS